ncbi:p38 MAP kinase [Acrasis kona]|uniref:P38 MAP kinase n=1 Tax=Acrasis kona TaxID=1008807 RepID=A0AAW2Z6Q1_9EUKA
MSIVEDVICKHEFRGNVYELPARYHLLRLIGSQGTFGTIIYAYDEREQQYISIKVIEDPFSTNAEKFYRIRVQRELLALCMIRSANIVRILELPIPKETCRFENVYLVTEHVETDLKVFMADKTNKISTSQIRHIMRQILIGIRDVHNHGIMHCDIKPANILLNKDLSNIKLCDFGSCCLFSDQYKCNSSATSTLWYRAPELLVACCDYDSSVDMWSVGCVFAELLLGRVMFRGRDELHQFHLVSNFNVRSLFSDTIEDSALNLLERLLIINPKHRITAHDALGDCYFQVDHTKEGSNSPGRRDNPYDRFKDFENCSIKQNVYDMCNVLNNEKSHPLKHDKNDFGMDPTFESLLMKHTAIDNLDKESIFILYMSRLADMADDLCLCLERICKEHEALELSISTHQLRKTIEAGRSDLLITRDVEKQLRAAIHSHNVQLDVE